MPVVVAADSAGVSLFWPLVLSTGYDDVAKTIIDNWCAWWIGVIIILLLFALCAPFNSHPCLEIPLQLGGQNGVYNL